MEPIVAVSEAAAAPLAAAAEPKPPAPPSFTLRPANLFAKLRLSGVNKKRPPIALVAPHHMGAKPQQPTEVKRPELAVVAAAVPAAAVPAAPPADAEVVWRRCTHCERRFTTPQGLATHAFRAHGVRKDRSCRLLTIESGDQKSIYRMPADVDSGVPCPLCTERFVGPSALSRHITTDHKDPTLAHFACNECPRTYRTYDCLQKHQRIDHNRGAVDTGLSPDWKDSALAPSTASICPECDAAYSTEHRLSMHILVNHRDTPNRHFRCESCPAAFRTLEILRKHRKKHERSIDQPFPCDLCCMRFATWPGVITHQSQMHGKITDAARQLKPEREKNLECPQCKELFDCKRALSDHVVTATGHEELKPFECEFCHIFFHSYITMKFHRRLTHFRRRDGSFKYDCDVCTRRFHKWEGLRIHQMMMHGYITDACLLLMYERDYGQQCPLCQLYYQGPHSLSEHIAGVHPDYEGKLFACKQCDKTYRHYAHLRSHMHTKHDAPMKFKRTKKVCRAVGGDKLATVPSTTEEQSAETKEEGGAKAETSEQPVETEPATDAKQQEESGDESDYDYVMISDVESEEPEDEEGDQEMEEGECDTEEDEPTTSTDVQS